MLRLVGSRAFRGAMSTRGDRFRDFLRIVARGPTLSRPLDVAEAEEAFGLVLDGDSHP